MHKKMNNNIPKRVEASNVNADDGNGSESESESNDDSDDTSDSEEEVSAIPKERLARAPASKRKTGSLKALFK
jgi:hypothetical protein